MRGKRLLFDYVKANWYRYVLAVSIMGVAQVIHSLFPIVVGNFTDELEMNGLTAQGVRHYGLLLLAIGVGYGVMFGFGQYNNHKLGRTFEYQARQQLFEHFTPLKRVRISPRTGSASCSAIVMNDVSSVRESIANAINQLTIGDRCCSLSVIVMLAVSEIPFDLYPGLCRCRCLSIPLHRASTSARASAAGPAGARIAGGDDGIGGGAVRRHPRDEEVRGGGDRDASASARRWISIRDNQLAPRADVSRCFSRSCRLSVRLSLVIAIVYGGWLDAAGQR